MSEEKTQGQVAYEAMHASMRERDPKHLHVPFGRLDEELDWDGLNRTDMEAAAQAVLDNRPAQAPRDDAGTIKHIPTGATWVTWDQAKQPPWELVAEAVARLTGGAVKIRPCRRDEDEPDRLAVAVYRNLPEDEDDL